MSIKGDAMFYVTALAIAILAVVVLTGCECKRTAAVHVADVEDCKVYAIGGNTACGDPLYVTKCPNRVSTEHDWTEHHGKTTTRKKRVIETTGGEQ